MSTTSPIRRGLIAKIHVAKKQMGMDEDSYRAMLRRHGADSASTMSLEQLESVLQELQAKGFKPTPPKKAGARKQANGEEVKKIRALWLFLHQIGAVNNPTEAALAVYAKRMVGVDDLRWVDGTRSTRLIEALKNWAVRVLPEKLDAKLIWLQDTGLFPARTHLGNVLERVAPTLRPDTYDALYRVWAFFEDIEHGRRDA